MTISEYKSNVVAGLIGSVIFLYFLNPILDFFGKIVFKVIAHTYSRYIDKLYSQAALGVTQTDFLLYALAMSGFVGFVVGSTWGSRRKRSTEAAASRSRASQIWNGPIVSNVLIGLLLLAVVMTIFNIWFQFRVITSFNQHLTILAPYISTDEERALRSRWASMKSERDYKNIYGTVESIANKNGIALPDNPVYSLTSI